MIVTNFFSFYDPDRIIVMKSAVMMCKPNIVMCILRLKGPENTISRDYILPDYTHIKRGYVRSQEESSKAKGDEQVVQVLHSVSLKAV